MPLTGFHWITVSAEVLTISFVRPALSFFPYLEKAEVITVGAPDKYGKPTVVETNEHDCHISMNSENEVFLDFMGEQAVYFAKIMFPYPVTVKVNDLIEFTDDLGKRQKKKVLAVQVKRDFGKNIIAVKALV